MSRLSQAKFLPSFSRDLKRNAGRRNWNLSELEGVIDLILENSVESMDTLKRRHGMHRLRGEWDGSNECHIANSPDWLLVWRVECGIAFFQRTGSHRDIFR